MRTEAAAAAGAGDSGCRRQPHVGRSLVGRQYRCRSVYAPRYVAAEEQL